MDLVLFGKFYPPPQESRKNRDSLSGGLIGPTFPATGVAMAFHLVSWLWSWLPKALVGYICWFFEAFCWFFEARNEIQKPVLMPSVNSQAGPASDTRDYPE